MLIKEMYEPIYRSIDDSIISLGLFNSYDEARDAAIMQGASTLPENENLKAFEINKVYINASVVNLEG